MAGVSTKEIKNRIRSMESTKQITRAMEMVAASKLRRAQAQAVASRPYFESIYGVIQDIARLNREATLPYFAPAGSAGSRPLYVVIAGDRGLAGGYNSNMFKLCQESLAGMAAQNAEVLPIGKKALEFFTARKYNIFSDGYSEAASIAVSDCFTMAKALCRAYREGRFDEIHICYTSFVSVLSQVPKDVRLLPLEPAEPRADRFLPDMIYEPNSAEVFKAIIPEYLGGVIYSAVCESRASEQAARRTAMDAATQNAEDMIADLSLKYNQARQAAITQEITEIVAGV